MQRKKGGSSSAAPSNKDALIRAGKRERWNWEMHEVHELRRKLQAQAGAGDGAISKVLLWAFDDGAMAHTKRRQHPQHT